MSLYKQSAHPKEKLNSIPLSPISCILGCFEMLQANFSQIELYKALKKKKITLPQEANASCPLAKTSMETILL